MPFIVAEFNKHKDARYTFDYVEDQTSHTLKCFVENPDTYRNLVMTLKIMYDNPKSYDFNTKDITTIFNYIEKHKSIKDDVIKQILKPQPRNKIELMTLANVKKAMTVDKTLKIWKYQRDVDNKHVQNIKNMIKETYLNPEFTLSTIHVFEKNDKYYIIDGMHRCYAISEIEDDEPCMRQYIYVQHHTCNIEQQEISLFHALNEAKPRQNLTLDVDLLNSIKETFTKSVIAYYGHLSVIRSTAYKTTFDHRYNLELTNSFIDAKNINKLLYTRKITLPNAKELFEHFKLINKALLLCFPQSTEEQSIFKGEDHKLSDLEINEIVEIVNELNKAKVVLRSTDKKKEKVITTIENIRDKHNEPLVLAFIYNINLVDVIDKIRTLCIKKGVDIQSSYYREDLEYVDEKDKNSKIYLI